MGEGRNVQALRRAYELFAAGDPAPLLGLFHPEVELRPARDTGETMRGIDLDEVYRGHEGLTKLWTQWFSVWGEFRWVLQGITEVDPDTMLVHLSQHAVGRGSGIEVSEPEVAHVVRFSDGKVRDFRFFNDRDEAAREVGLAE